VSTATGRTLGLLDAATRASAHEVDGYLDTLPEGLEVGGVAQNLMRSGAVTSIYERWWRPGLGRLVKGALGPGMADEHRIARLLLGLRPGDGVLDLACGPGNFSREFASVVGPDGLVVGFDASPVMLAKGVSEARSAGVTNLSFVHGNATELPFRDSSFDAACCFAALHMFDNPFAALDEMRRVLTPGGQIAILTSCRSKSGAFRAYEQLVGHGSGMRLFERDEVTDALRARGFSDIQQRLSGFVQFVGGRLS
jgi:SAM-dependent methyltransferase